MTMLNHPWPLHDIDDAEAYVHASLHKILKSRNQHLDWARHEDAQQDLIVALWELSNTWRPTPKQRSFRRYASPLLGKRYIDWLRRTEGRTRWQYANRTVERPAPALLSLDGPAGRDDRGTRLGEVLCLPGSVLGSDRAPDDRTRLLGERRSSRAWHLAVLRQKMLGQTAA